MPTDLYTEVKAEGTPEELFALVRVLRLFETENRTRFQTRQDRTYLESVGLGEVEEEIFLKGLTDEEVLAWLDEHELELMSSALGPFGRIRRLEDVGLFECLADAAPDAWFEADISGTLDSRDVFWRAELDRGILRCTAEDEAAPGSADPDRHYRYDPRTGERTEE